MAKSFGINSTLNRALKVSIQFTTIQLANQVVNSQPNIPPLVKTLVGFGTAFAGYEIINSALDVLPSNMRSIAKTLNTAQASIFAIQQIPNLMQAIGGPGASTSPFGQIPGISQ